MKNIEYEYNCKEIGQIIQSHRKLKKITQSELSETVLNIEPNTLSKVENGKLSLSLDKFLRVASYLEIDVNSIIGVGEVKQSHIDYIISNLLSKMNVEDKELIFDIIQVVYDNRQRLKNNSN